MISFTDGALKKVKEIISSDPSAKFLRIGVRGGGCKGFSVVVKSETSEETDKDIVLTFGDTLVIVDVKSADILCGSEIDYNKSLMTQGFSFKIPSAEKFCGCGSSFSLK